VVFLPRHDKGHRLSPSDINYRANIDALKRAGVTDLVSLSACGSFKEDLPPGTFVLVDQFVDRTHKRELVLRQGLRRACLDGASGVPRLRRASPRPRWPRASPCIRGGTYVCMEGPQFSTLRRDLTYKQLGYSVIGMTNMPEAKLAREAEICYATVAMVTDFDCWHPDHDAVTVQDIIKVLMANAEPSGWSRGLPKRLVSRRGPGARLPARARAGCPIGSDRALDTALRRPRPRRSPRRRRAIRILDCIKKLDAVTSAWPRRLDDRELLAPSAMAALAGNPLLRCMLVSAPVRDIGLEILLTAIRRALLLRAADGGDDAALALGSALARQCFVNEYVFSTTPEEDAAAERLKQSIGDAIAGRSGIDAMTLALAGCYFALSSLPGAERLLDRKWPAPLDAVLTQQLREPLEERRLSESMPRLTAIADATSLRVREQYEANPYPRWVLAPPAPAPAAVDDYFLRRFPHAPLQATGVAEPEILVAGCGTGQQPIGMARRFSGARVLAIDLSLASLGYARRKSNELGIRNIDHAQADILELPSLGRTFDIVDSRGVLHHLADPEAGWRALLSMLRPRGLMAVGLYSEAARRQVAAARAFCMERGFQATARDIAACRHALLSAGFRSFEMVNDFFTVSECRDLLFHVSEQQFTVARIRSLLGGGAVRLIGFDVPAAVAAAYRQRFPGDPAMCDLANWERIENELPDTFASMYQFWVQKA
jgi:purine nucleoside phosphorylase/2-polyprenyl-3-methyl-5-hydroxy-6-metoxy-1,4-benzoquinol methylase